MCLAGAELQPDQSAACARTRAPMRDHVHHLLLSGLSWGDQLWLGAPAGSDLTVLRSAGCRHVTIKGIRKMCDWKSNKTHKDKGTTAAGQARLEGLCPPAPGRALAPRQRTQTQNADTDTTHNQPATQPKRSTTHNSTQQHTTTTTTMSTRRECPVLRVSWWRVGSEWPTPTSVPLCCPSLSASATFGRNVTDFVIYKFKFEPKKLEF